MNDSLTKNIKLDNVCSVSFCSLCVESYESFFNVFIFDTPNDLMTFRRIIFKTLWKTLLSWKFDLSSWSITLFEDGCGIL